MTKMKLMKELLESADDIILENGFVAVERCLGEMRNLVRELPLTEGFTDNHRGDLDRKFDDIEKKLIAARRMLGKLNGSSLSPEEQKVHKAKVMRYINIFRKQLYDVMLDMGMSSREMDYHLNRIDLDREHGKPSEVFTKGERDRTLSNQEAAQMLGVSLSRVSQFMQDGRLKSLRLSDVQELISGENNTDKRKFSDLVNAKRNLAAPDDVGAFKKPATKSGPDQRKWYQRIFGK